MPSLVNATEGAYNQVMKNREQTISLIGVIMLALVLPGILKLTNSVVKFFVGAEGRLAAISVETDRPLGELPRPWEALAQGGENLETFLEDPRVKERIRESKIKYIRVDHVFDILARVSRGAGGQLEYDWTKLDKLVDQILDVGAKPFVALSYMPAALSSGDEISEPNNWNEWKNLVQTAIERYSGQKNIEDIYYEVWNEPDLFGKWKMGRGKNYQNLYRYSALAAVDARNVKPFKLCGPGTTGLYKNWLDGFFPYILRNNLRLDCFSWHRYDLDSFKYSEDVESVEKWIETHPYFSGVEKIVTEMGPNSEAGNENNTKVGAAHLVAVMRELMGKIKYGFSFSVTGGWGIVDNLTPRYEALKMLSRLGPVRLGVSGDGTWVRAIGAQDGDKYQVLLANYDPRSTHSENVPVTFMNLKSQNFTLKKYLLGRGALPDVQVATTEAILQTEIPMTANSVVLVELQPR